MKIGRNPCGRKQDWGEAAAELAMNGISPRILKEYSGKRRRVDLSTPKCILYPEPFEEDKTLLMVCQGWGECMQSPSIIGTYMPTLHKSDIEETHDQVFRLKTYHPLFQGHKDQDQRLRTCWLNQTVPEPNPAGWSKRPATVSAGRPVFAGWLNPAARPYFRPSSVYFNNKTNFYDPMFMYKGRWDTAVKTSAGYSWRNKRPHFWGPRVMDWIPSIHMLFTINDPQGSSSQIGLRSRQGNKRSLLILCRSWVAWTKFGGGECRITGKGPSGLQSLTLKMSTMLKSSSTLTVLCGTSEIPRDMISTHLASQPATRTKGYILIRTSQQQSLDEIHQWPEGWLNELPTLNRLAKDGPGHLKPFGYQVTILNTSDHLGKFEGKADEGYLVGYAPNSKAYRGIGHEWYFDLDYLTDSLGYTRFKTDTPAGTQETNINAGTQDHDSDSEVDEQVIVVPSFPSNSFSGPSSSNGPSVMERNADYAEELAKLQRQEYEAKDAAARYGYLFSQATAEILCQAEAEIRNQGVSAVRDPAGIDSAVRDPAGIDSAVRDTAAINSAGDESAGSPSAGSDPAGGNPADSSQPAGSFEPADESNPAVSSSVSADFIPDECYFRMNTTSRESDSKTDERIDKLADQLSTIVEIVSTIVEIVEETCVTYGGAHSWYNCPTTDNNQASVCATTGTYNQVNPPNRVSNQMAPPGFAPVQNNGQNRFNNQVQGNNFNRGNNFHGNQGFQAQNNHALNFQNQGFQNQPFQVPNNQVQQEISNDFSSYKRNNDQMLRNMQNQINSLKGDLKNEIQNTIKSQQAVMMNQQTTFQTNL
ncbi:hypothetical protein Tco_1282184 [Tanacetum coccineum]